VLVAAAGPDPFASSVLPLTLVPVLAATALPVAVLIWDGGQVSPACDRSAELERNVAAYLGRDAFEANAPLVIRIGLRRSLSDGAIAADISKIGEDGQVVGVRTVSGGTSCETLDDPLTLVVALMLDAPPDEPPPALLSAGIGSSIGLLPFPNFGPRLQVNLKPRGFWGISLGALALVGSHTDLPGSGAIDFRLLQAGAALCPLDTIHDRNWVAVCGGLEIAWFEAEGSDLSPHRRKFDWAFSPSLYGQVARQVVGPILLGGTLGISFPISRNRYVYQDVAGSSQLAFQVASPALVLGVFAALRLH
jgi:hypothetical protein